MLRLIQICFALLYASTLFSQNCRTVNVDVSYYIQAPGKTHKVRILGLFPPDIAGLQVIKEITFSDEPVKIFEENGKKYVDFVLHQISDRKTITMSMSVELYSIDFVNKTEKSVRIDKKKYLAKEDLIETDDPAIIAKAKELKSKNTIETVKNIHSFIRKHMHFTLNNEDLGAKYALETGRGDCSEHADLMVALCRVNNIPARIVGGYAINYDGGLHRWVEVYFEKYGWVRFDPTRDSFDRLKNEYYIQISYDRKNLVFNSTYYRFWWKGDPFKVDMRFREKNSTPCI